MASATREALGQSVAALEAAESSVDLSTAAQLLEAGHVIDGSAQLRSAIADASAEADTKARVVTSVFGGRLSETALSLLTVIARGRWSRADDLLNAVEELGIRAAAVSAPDAAIESELFQFSRVIASDPELELALSAKLGSGDSKAGLVEKLLAGKASEQTVLILSHLVREARGRRIGELLHRAESIVASQRGRTIATVTSARALNDGQISRLREVLAGMYNRDVTFNLVVDPELVGGLRIQAGDDVIDGSIAARLGDLKLKLAG